MARTSKSNGNKKLNAKKGNDTELLKKRKQAAERKRIHREKISRLKSNDKQKEDGSVHAAKKKKDGMKRGWQ